MKHYDYLIVGSGLYGATFAYQATQRGKKCLVIDRREHLGGNLRCEEVEGIMVHWYGPHIFHTSNKRVWDFVNSITPFEPFINTPLAIIIGMVYNFLPYMVLPLYVAINRIDSSIIEAARDLGANPYQTFRRVLLPLSMPGIVSGSTMVFIPALTTFVISALLGGNKVLLVGNIIEQEFTAAYDWQLGSALSMVLMVFIILNILLEAFTDNGEQAKKGVRP